MCPWRWPRLGRRRRRQVFWGSCPYGWAVPSSLAPLSVYLWIARSSWSERVNLVRKVNLVRNVKLFRNLVEYLTLVGYLAMDRQFDERHRQRQCDQAPSRYRAPPIAPVRARRAPHRVVYQ